MNWPVVISLAIFIVVNLIAVTGAYYGLKADNASLGSKLELGLLTERAERHGELAAARSECITKIQSMEQAIKDIGFRVGTLETGQDEWTKTLRERTHELSILVNQLVLKVDRLERPGTVV